MPRELTDGEKINMIRICMADADNYYEEEMWRQELTIYVNEIVVPAEVPDLKAFMRMLLHAVPVQKIDKTILITRYGVDLMRIDTPKIQKNLQRYVRMFHRGDKKFRAGDLHKLKITTSLLYINDAVHIFTIYITRTWNCIELPSRPSQYASWGHAYVHIVTELALKDNCSNAGIVK